MPWPFTSTPKSDRPTDAANRHNPQSASSKLEREPPLPPPTHLSSSNSTSTPLPTWTTLTHPSTLISTAVLTTALLLSYRIYTHYLRRIPNVDHIPPSYYRQRSLFGTCTSVGDGDNFRIYHTPGGLLALWPPFPLSPRRIPSPSLTQISPQTGRAQKVLTAQTVHLRLAGIDAPEAAHFGRPAQPFSDTALAWLRARVQGRRVRAVLWKRDQYDRAVATVWVRAWLWGVVPLGRRDVGFEMLRAGLATVYEAKSGAEFGGREELYREAERVAKEKARGMWAQTRRSGVMGAVLGREREKGSYESPREYKTRVVAEEAAAAAATSQGKK